MTQDIKKTEEVEVADKVRLICTIQAASSQIDGILFGQLGNARVSEAITPERAVRYLSIEGFAEWKGLEEDAAEVDADIAKALRATPGGGGVVQADQKAEIASMNASNLRLSHELFAANQKIETLEADNIKLRKELAGLGIRVTPPKLEGLELAEAEAAAA